VQSRNDTAATQHPDPSSPWSSHHHKTRQHNTQLRSHAQSAVHSQAHHSSTH
jgi:hypothetical protein